MRAPLYIRGQPPPKTPLYGSIQIHTDLYRSQKISTQKIYTSDMDPHRFPTEMSPEIAALYRPECLESVIAMNRQANAWLDMPEKELKKLLAQERRRRKKKKRGRCASASKLTQTHTNSHTTTQTHTNSYKIHTNLHRIVQNYVQ